MSLQGEILLPRVCLVSASRFWDKGLPFPVDFLFLGEVLAQKGFDVSLVDLGLERRKLNLRSEEEALRRFREILERSDVALYVIDERHADFRILRQITSFLKSSGGRRIVRCRPSMREMPGLIGEIEGKVSPSHSGGKSTFEIPRVEDYLTFGDCPVFLREGGWSLWKTKIENPACVLEAMKRFEAEFGSKDFCISARDEAVPEIDWTEWKRAFKRGLPEDFVWCLKVHAGQLSGLELEELNALRCRGLHLILGNSDGVELVDRAVSLKMHVTVEMDRALNAETVLLGLKVKQAGAEEVRFLQYDEGQYEFCVFFEELINQLPDELAQVLESSGWSCADLYGVWTSWKTACFPNMAVDGTFVFNTFRLFLNDAVWITDASQPAFHPPSKKPLLFLGPSISRADAEKYIDAELRPPIRRGDLPRAVREGYRVIGIIDGVFHHEFSVSLQEIREAIEWGAVLYGSSSMGALRAADARSLGMTGIGSVYEWYRSEKIESDDEVALCFDEASGSALSEPLVNIRATLEKMTLAGELSEQHRRVILETAIRIPYWQRSIPELFRRLSDTFREEELFRLQEQYARHSVDLKREDAVLLLKALRNYHERSKTPHELSD